MVCVPAPNVRIPWGVAVLPWVFNPNGESPGIGPKESLNVTKPEGKPCPDCPATSARKYTKLSNGRLVKGTRLPFWFRVSTEIVVVLGSGVIYTPLMGCADMLGA